MIRLCKQKTDQNIKQFGYFSPVFCLKLTKSFCVIGSSLRVTKRMHFVCCDICNDRKTLRLQEWNGPEMSECALETNITVALKWLWKRMVLKPPFFLWLCLGLSNNHNFLSVESENQEFPVENLCTQGEHTNCVQCNLKDLTLVRIISTVFDAPARGFLVL